MNCLLFFSFVASSLALSVNVHYNNWEKVADDATPGIFSARMGHASVVYESKIWVTGGKSDTYQAYDLEYTDRNADVYFSSDAETWTKVTDMTGDYGIQTTSVPVPGEIAPWYSRYGHTLDTLDTDNDGVDDLMVIIGGFAPIPYNDIWASRDGHAWYFGGYMPFAPRAWHSTAKLNGSLILSGGSPLNNDVWRLESVEYYPNRTIITAPAITDDEGRIGVPAGTRFRTLYKFNWEQLTPPSSQVFPWRPRAAHTMTQHWTKNNVTGIVTECLYIAGGLAGWTTAAKSLMNASTVAHLNDDGQFRTRNDIWRSYDGRTWSLVLDEAPWRGRGWHTMTVWKRLDEAYSSDDDQSSNSSNSVSSTGSQHTTAVVNVSDVSKSSNADDLPRMWLTGGGYIGSKGSATVSKMIGMVDEWWTRDGDTWHKVNYEEGSQHEKKDNMYSTSEWSITTIDGKNRYRGKYGHTVVQFQREMDLESMFNDYGEDQLTAAAEIALQKSQIGAESVTVVPSRIKTIKLSNVMNESHVDEIKDDRLVAKSKPAIKAVSNYGSAFYSAMILIGGDTVEDGSLETDIFATSYGILCTLDGIACNKAGKCGGSVLKLTTAIKNALSAISKGSDAEELDYVALIKKYLSPLNGCSCDVGARGEYCQDEPPKARSSSIKLLLSPTLLWAIILIEVICNFLI